MSIFTPSRRALLCTAGAAFALAGLGIPPAAAALSPQDQADVAKANAYLNDVRTLTAKFLQVAPDGSLSEGQLYMRRPGRIRFEYAPPSPLLIVSDSILLTYLDKELKQVERVPVGSTPLDIFVRDKVALDSGDAAITRIERQPGSLRMTMIDPKKPKEGALTLVFTIAPFALKQWEVTDARGQVTTVALSDVVTNVELKQGLFVFTDSDAARLLKQGN